MAVIMTREQIEAILPQRPPMLLIDEVTGLMPGEQAIASYTVPNDAPFLEGHFPDYPVVPSFLLLESLFQAVELCVLAQPLYQGKEMFLMESSKIKFNGRVSPDDTLSLHVKITKNKNEIVTAKCIASLSDKTIVSGDMIASISGSNLEIK